MTIGELITVLQAMPNSGAKVMVRVPAGLSEVEQIRFESHEYDRFYVLVSASEALSAEKELSP